MSSNSETEEEVESNARERRRNELKKQKKEQNPRFAKTGESWPVAWVLSGFKTNLKAKLGQCLTPPPLHPSPRLPLLSKRNLISTINTGSWPAPAPETLRDVISRAFPFICQPSLTEHFHLLMWRHWQISSIYLCDVIDKSVPFIFVTSLRGLFHSPLWHRIAFYLSINSLWIRM